MHSGKTLNLKGTTNVIQYRISIFLHSYLFPKIIFHFLHGQNNDRNIGFWTKYWAVLVVEVYQMIEICCNDFSMYGHWAFSGVLT